MIKRKAREHDFNGDELELLLNACISAKYEARRVKREELADKYANLQNKIVDMQNALFYQQ